jgi:hypothetical protein
MIDHSGHPHPSTPAARALCRANGGTGNITKPGKSASKTSAPKKKTPARPQATNAPSLTGSKVPVPKKAATPAAPAQKKSAKPKVTATPRVITDISTGKPISREQAALIMFGSDGPGKRVAVRKQSDTRVTGAAVKAAQKSGIGAKLDATDADRAKAAQRKAEREETLKRIAARKTPMSAAKHSQVMSKTADEDDQAEMLQAAPIGIDGLDSRGFKEGEKEAADFYIGAGYTFVNASLRGQSQATDKAKETIEKLDAVMERSKLTEDVGVYRGLENGRKLFGDSFDGDLTGVEWKEKAYSSTTVNEDVADDFIGADSEDNDDLDPSELGPMKMRIVLPKGTPAMQASDVDDEAELIVGRNSNFRVIKDNGEDDSGVRVIDVELIL